MALLNFLYKDDALIRSLYAQIFNGLLKQVSHQESSSNQERTDIGAKLPILKAQCRTGSGSEFSREEVIDPHDTAALDVLNHLDPYVVEERDCKPGSIVKMRGGLFLVPFALRKTLLEFGFGVNSRLFDRALQNDITDKKYRTKFISLARESCIGDEDEVRMFFQSDSGLWYWGALNEKEITNHMNALKVTHGVNLIPASLMAIYLGATYQEDEDAEEQENSAFARHIQGMTTLSNSVLAGEVPLTGSIAPLALVQEIVAETYG